MEPFGKYATSGIYAIYSKTGQKTYIGSSRFVGGRIMSHLSALMAGRHQNSKLQKAFARYGATDFEFTVLVRCDPDYMLRLEAEIIRSTPATRAYNIKSKRPAFRPPNEIERARIINFKKLLRHPGASYASLARSLDISRGTLHKFVNDGYIPRRKDLRNKMGLDSAETTFIVQVRDGKDGRFT